MPRTLFADYPTRFSLQIAFLWVLGVTSVHAQVQQAWVARYNGAGSDHDLIYGVAVDTSGNVYVTGNSKEGPNVQSFTTIKYNSAGIEQWVNKTGTHSGGGQAIAVTPAGDVYVTGNFTFPVLPGGGGGTNGDFCTIKYDASGAQQWFVTYNGPQNSSDYAKSMALDSAGNVYVTGGSPGLTTAYDIATVKYSSAGVEQWVQRYTGPDRDNDEPRAIAVDRWGNVYVTGYDDRGPNTEWVTIKYSPAGAEEWVRRYGESSSQPGMANGLVIDSAGNVYVTGSVLNSGTNNDYTTIKYSPSGVEEWVRTYNGPSGNGDDYPYAIAIDRQGMIYVTGASYGGTGTDGDCTTIKYSPDGVELWVRRYNSLESKYDWGWDVAVDTSGNVVVGGGYTDLDGRGHFLTLSYDSLGNAKWAERFDGAGDDNDALRAVAVDLAGNAYVAGSSYEGTATRFDFATIKYSPQRIAVTRPRSGERWISGSQDTIRWTGGVPGEFLDIEYTLDSGQPYRSIDLAIAADSGYYLWNHPDSLLSARARIRLLDSQGNAVLAESDTFRLKAYFLTRLDASGQYEAFLPAKHGWSFANSPNNFWPQSWWNQFQYAGGIDRHTGEAYSPIFAASPVSAQPQDFNDWPVFVDVFGRDGCFWFGTDIYRDRSVDYWDIITRNWNGSCFGVALTGLLYFHYREQFRSLHPTIPFTDSLGSIQTMTDAIRATVNRYFAMQFGDLKLAHDQVNATTTPRQTLAWIRQMWANDNPDDDAGLRYIAAPPLAGGHAVIPYRLQRVAANPNQFRLYLCNSNNPTSLNDFILIDSLANTWQEFTGFGWGVGTVGMHPYPPAVSFFQPTAFYEPYFSSQVSRVGETRTGPLWIATPRATDVLILSGNGDSTGIASGSVFNSMPGAVPMIPETGYPQPPIAYQVPGGTYKMRITNPLDSMVVLSVRTNRPSPRMRAARPSRPNATNSGMTGRSE